MRMTPDDRASVELALLKAIREAEQQAEILGRFDLAHELRVIRGRLFIKQGPPPNAS